MHLHNFETDEWDQKETSSGQSTYDYGWDIWEEWYMEDNWPTLPQLYSRELSVCDGQRWRYVTAGWGYVWDGTEEGFPPHGFVHEFYHWWVGPKG